MKNQIRSFFLRDDGEIPNNQDFPVIVYEGVLRDNPSEIEATFNRHQWLGSWTNGVFDYHHYHSNSHEVLGVKSGHVTVLVGGDEGERLELNVGDVIVLPAGTGHKKINCSENFQVVGAYPEGMNHNLVKRDPRARIQALEEIKNVPIPKTDPVFGETGPLIDKWYK